MEDKDRGLGDSSKTFAKNSSGDTYDSLVEQNKYWEKNQASIRQRNQNIKRIRQREESEQEEWQRNRRK